MRIIFLLLSFMTLSSYGAKTKNYEWLFASSDQITDAYPNYLAYRIPRLFTMNGDIAFFTEKSETCSKFGKSYKEIFYAFRKRNQTLKVREILGPFTTKKCVNVSGAYGFRLLGLDDRVIKKGKVYEMLMYVAGVSSGGEDELVLSFRVDLENEQVNHQLTLSKDNTQFDGKPGVGPWPARKHIFSGLCGHYLMGARYIPGKNKLLFVYRDPALLTLDYSNPESFIIDEIYSGDDGSRRKCNGYAANYEAFRSDKSFERLLFDKRLGLIQFFHKSLKLNQFILTEIKY